MSSELGNIKEGLAAFSRLSSTEAGERLNNLKICQPPKNIGDRKFVLSPYRTERSNAEKKAAEGQ
jgi:hypothetical protein